ncbi:non-ribosomal peptide synthetase [Amycolatopsis samaneae]|uniref:Amino acid adenylation domain-containing protein n=1 Tax=Amycolatopsis samaneae TaxID=664691 RepID=A0ABW5G8H1_9PSEU
MSRAEGTTRTPAGGGREYWAAVLAGSGATRIPQWTLRPEPGTAEYESPIHPDLVAALRRLTGELSVPVGSALLAAHAKVLAALSGEPEVCWGHRAGPGGRPLPCRVTAGPGTWRELLAEAAMAEAELLAHKDFPLDELRRELGVAGPVFETVLDPDGSGGDLPGGVALSVALAGDGEGFRLRIRYRTDVLDAECAARIGGYHHTALTALGTDPDGDHGVRGLLSDEEITRQLEGLAGPHRALPDLRCHELFEQQARVRPDAVAAVHGTRRWTYRQLNTRANRLARALVARGLRREGVVAVVTERGLDWLAAVLAIFKAGGVYLPIEPHFPADRIAKTLSRAECRLALTEPGSSDTLDEALGSLPGVRCLDVDAAYTEEHAATDLGVEVTPDQLAYIYFTSGSTGEPKGAMLEHAGLLNHLYAKIDDLGIAEGQVVAQTAPQCFDISLWQLVSALLVGGRTLVIGQETILDVRRFVDTVAEGRVNVLQLVPSYLEVVLSYVEQHPHPLPDLRCVSVTGEALKKELTERWFAAKPGIKLMNAYGLTETSDDTNHEVMTGPPERDRVPLGPAVNNVHVYVVDERLDLVPLGAPGEIVFSGVCVGRGYVNDPDRTRAAFTTDPHRPGNRLYRSGDHGRWLPEGKLEFLGRRDTQVKIRGFRIEIGEIENTLLRVPGVRDGAVVVTERPDRSKHLVAFYAASHPLETETLRTRLGASLPEYMVPAAFQWQDSLPLNANGKIDKKRLTALAAELHAADGADGDRHAPGTPAERRLADAWAGVLGVRADQVDRRDHFFERGGSSLSAVKLAIALDRTVSLKDITRHPVLADLAALLDAGPQAPGGTPQPLLHPLLEPAEPAWGTLVCFPYAGGNAVNFRPMATALAGAGLAVHAVELPGHDPAADTEPLAPLADVVDQVVAEITGLGPGRVLLWGHSSGAAFALETARRLRDREVTVEHVFLGAQLLGDAATRRGEIARLAGRSNTGIATKLAEQIGHADLGELTTRRAEHIGAVYRHDFLSALRYYVDALDTPPGERLSAPVTTVLAADDPATANSGEGHLGWQLFAEHVEVDLLPAGGHYFPHTRPAEAARAVLRAARLSSTH